MHYDSTRCVSIAHRDDGSNENRFIFCAATRAIFLYFNMRDSFDESVGEAQLDEMKLSRLLLITVRTISSPILICDGGNKSFRSAWLASGRSIA